MHLSIQTNFIGIRAEKNLVYAAREPYMKL